MTQAEQNAADDASLARSRATGIPQTQPLPDSPTPVAAVPAPEPVFTVPEADAYRHAAGATTPTPAPVTPAQDPAFTVPEEDAARYQQTAPLPPNAFGTFKPVSPTPGDAHVVDATPDPAFTVPESDREAHIRQLADGPYDPVKAFLEGATDVDAAAKAMQDRFAAEKSKSPLEQAGDAIVGKATDAVKTGVGIAEGVASLPGQLPGVEEARQNLGKLLPQGNSIELQRATAAEDLAAKKITPEQFQAIQDAGAKLDALEKRAANGEISDADYKAQAAALEPAPLPPPGPEHQQAARETVSGIEKGLKGGLETVAGVARQVVNNALSWPMTALMAPVTIAHALFDGPPSAEAQTGFLSMGVPIPSGKDPSKMSFDELKSDLLVQKAQADQDQALSQGHLGAVGEGILSYLNGGTPAPSAEQQNAGPFPVRPEAVAGANLLTMAALSAVPIPGLEQASALMAGTALKGLALPVRAAGWGAEKTASIALKATKQWGGFGVLGLLNHLEQWPRAMEAAAAWTALKGTALGAPHLASLLDEAGHDLLLQGGLIQGEALVPKGFSSELLVPKQGPIAQFVSRNLQNVAKGGATGAMFTAPTATDPESFGQGIGQMAALEGATRAPGTALQVGRSTLFDSFFLHRGADPKTPTVSPDYGHTPTLDSGHREAMAALGPHLSEQVNAARESLRGNAEVYVVPDTGFEGVADKAAAAKGLDPEKVKALGVTQLTGPGGIPQVFLRASRAGDALYHETGHAYWPYLDAATKEAFIQTQFEHGDPDTFTKQYIRKFTGEDTNVRFNDLPTVAEANAGQPLGPAGLTREKALEEMGANAFDSLFHGQTVEQLSKAPTEWRKLQAGLGVALERLGVPTVTRESQTILGVRPSFISALLLDQFVRKGLGTATPQPPWAFPPPEAKTSPRGPELSPELAYGPTGPRPSSPPPLPQRSPANAMPGVTPIYTPTGPSLTHPPVTPKAPVASPASPAGASERPPAPNAPSGGTGRFGGMPGATSPKAEAQPTVPLSVDPKVAEARNQSQVGLQGMGFTKAKAKAMVDATTGTTPDDILREALANRGRSLFQQPATPPPAAPAKTVPPQDQAYQDALDKAAKGDEMPGATAPPAELAAKEGAKSPEEKPPREIDSKHWGQPVGEPLPGVLRTHYGYERPGEKDYDSNSAMGKGRFGNRLTPLESVALSPDLIERLRPKPGQPVEVTMSDGTRIVGRYDDVTAQRIRNVVDVYDPLKTLGDTAVSNVRLLDGPAKLFAFEGGKEFQHPGESAYQGGSGEGSGAFRGGTPGTAPEAVPTSVRGTESTPAEPAPAVPSEPAKRVAEPAPEAGTEEPLAAGRVKETQKTFVEKANERPVVEAPPASKVPEHPLTREDVERLAREAMDKVPNAAPNGEPWSPQKLEEFRGRAANLAVLTAHAKALEPGDVRVRQHLDPETGEPVGGVSGERFVPGDPVHEALLKGVPPGDLGHAQVWSDAIANNQPLTLTLRGAKASDQSPLAGIRKGEYASDPAQGRLAGESPGQEATKTVLPTSVGLSAIHSDGPAQLMLKGLSPDKLLQNFDHIRTALDWTHPARNFNHADFARNVAKYIDNQKAGFKGDGTAPLVNPDGTPVKSDPAYAPQLLGVDTPEVEAAKGPRSPQRQAEDSQKIAEVINAAFHNTASTGKGPKAERAQAFARANHGHVGATGETNALRERLDALWVKGTLVSPFEHFHAGNVVEFQSPNQRGPRAIRAQSGEVTKALGEHGLPDERAVESGFLGDTGATDRSAERDASFMPFMGAKARDFKKAEEEGRVFLSPYDQKKRFEVSDKDLTWKKPNGKPAQNPDEALLSKAKGLVRLDDAIDHPQLFENYPFLKQVKVGIDPSMPPSHAHYVPDAHEIEAGSLDKGLLVHEIQHAIQGHEGHPMGSSPESAFGNTELQEVQKRIENEFSAKYKVPAGTPPERMKELDQSRKEYIEQRVKNAAFNRYQANAGEIEAREAAGRQAFDARQRQEYPPYQKDRARFDQNDPGHIRPEDAWFMPRGSHPVVHAPSYHVHFHGMPVDKEGEGKKSN